MRNETIFVFAFPRAPNQLAARARHPDPGAESLTPMPVKALSVALRKLFGAIPVQRGSTIGLLFIAE